MTPDSFTTLAASFEKINLDQMDKVSFLSRKDTKYVVTTQVLHSIIEDILPEYYILEIDGFREFTYFSQYLDTSDFGMYMAHHNKRKTRFKCRQRIYENTGLTFWEIKHKTNHNVTKKKRIKISEDGLTKAEIEEFVSKYTPYHFDRLEPKLVSRFMRMTFVNKGLSERITIDRNLSWSNDRKEIAMEGLAIIEVKNDCKATLAQMYPVLHKHGVHSGSFSKYTFGCALLYNDLKKNLLKTKLSNLNKFCHAVTSKCTVNA